MAAIGAREASLIVGPEAAQYRWHPDAAEIAGLVADGGKILAREKARVRVGSGPTIGHPKLLTGDALKLARELWGRRDLTSKMVAAEILRQTKVKVSVRTLIIDLGHKTDAVARAERNLR